MKSSSMSDILAVFLAPWVRERQRPGLCYAVFPGDSEVCVSVVAKTDEIPSLDGAVGPCKANWLGTLFNVWATLSFSSHIKGSPFATHYSKVTNFIFVKHGIIINEIDLCKGTNQMNEFWIVININITRLDKTEFYRRSSVNCVFLLFVCVCFL